MSEDSKVDSPETAEDVLKSEEKAAADFAAAEAKRQFDLKSQAKAAAKTGAGFNQFDPVLSATSFISRRFGLVGGLAVVALLASTEGIRVYHT
jgi:hypothetical protein